MVQASKIFALTIPEYIASSSGEDFEDVDEETCGGEEWSGWSLL